MYFSSDNCAGASAKVIAALAAANEGYQSSYGGDDLSRKVEGRFHDLFDRPVGVVQVSTGTAANAIALSAMMPPYGAILCHDEAHIMTDECGAPEMYTGGAKLFTLPGVGAKLAPDTIKEALDRLPLNDHHHTPPKVVSITQATECGLVYTPDEVAAVAEVTHHYGLQLHMDGARFANAVAALGCHPADLTWRAGVDVLSFGATKNGCVAAEAIITFGDYDIQDLKFRRKRGGHLISKSRFVAAQLDAYLDNGHWLDMAGRANAIAGRLAEGIETSPFARLCWSVEANEVFAIFDRSVDAYLQANGAKYFHWASKGHTLPSHIQDNEVLARLVCSFAAQESEVDDFLSLLNAYSRSEAAE